MTQDIQAELKEILRLLTLRQLDYVAARTLTNTDKEAAVLSGLSPQTVSSWPNKDHVDLAVSLSKQISNIELAQAVMQRYAVPVVQMLGKIAVEKEDARDRDKISAGVNLLNRIGLGPTKNLKIEETYELKPSIEDLKAAEALIAAMERRMHEELSQEDDEEE